MQREFSPGSEAQANGGGAARGHGRGGAQLPGPRGGSKDKRPARRGRRTRRVRRIVRPPSAAASGSVDTAAAAAAATTRVRRTHSWLISLVTIAAVYGGWVLVRPLVVGRSAIVASNDGAVVQASTTSTIEMSDLNAGGAATSGDAVAPRLFDAHDSVRSDAVRWVAWSQDFAPLLPWSPAQSGAVLRRLIATHHPERPVPEGTHTANEMTQNRFKKPRMGSDSGLPFWNGHDSGLLKNAILGSPESDPILGLILGITKPIFISPTRKKESGGGDVCPCL